VTELDIIAKHTYVPSHDHRTADLAYIAAAVKTFGGMHNLENTEQCACQSVLTNYRSGAEYRTTLVIAPAISLC
jgi:hypothetical protein